MSPRTAYASLALFCSLSLVSYAQNDTSGAVAAIDRYDLRVSIDEGRRLLLGEARIRLHLLSDSVSHLRFELGASATVTGVRDTSNQKFGPVEALRDSDSTRSEISVGIPDTCKRGDTLLLTLSYQREYDSLSTLPSFINTREIVLLPGRWWPVLAPPTSFPVGQSAPTTFELVLPAEFTAVQAVPQDSSRTPGNRIVWRYVQSAPAPLASCFSVCASRNFTRSVAATPDSMSHISIYYDPVRFSPALAEAVVNQLRNAYEFFSGITGKKFSDVRLAIAGTDDGHAAWFTQNGLIVGRNSPAFAGADTSALLSSEMSPWVYSLAEDFTFDMPDSVSWFRAGWSQYLATKFFLKKAENNPEMQRHIRLALLSRTLDFYPLHPPRRGSVPVVDEEAVVNKAAYMFLMLEYVMGEEAFSAAVDSVVGSGGRAQSTVESFQRICERAYGSPLGWFFAQWLEYPGFPELVLSTAITQTNRGNYSVQATVTQRGDFFATPVDIVYSNDVRSVTRRVFVSKEDQKFEFILPFLPVRSELDPNYFVLRWVPKLRLLAHARASVSFRVFDRDLANSEREASVLLQLDPNNLTGWNNLALFSLGKISVLRGDLAKAEEYFRRASALEASDPTELYSVLSLVRLGNVLEMEGKREEAIDLYKLCITLAGRKPAQYAVALAEAQKYLSKKFESSENFWYGEY